jgi:hypothetical protein
VNVAADLGALEAKGGNYMAIGHTPNLGADPIHFLWQLRHNTGNFTKIGPLREKLPARTQQNQSVARQFPTK